MSGVMVWIAAEAERNEGSNFPHEAENVARTGHVDEEVACEVPVRDLPAHQFPAREKPHLSQNRGEVGHPGLLRPERDVRREAMSPPFAKDAKDGPPSENPSTSSGQDMGHPGYFSREVRDQEQDREQERRTYRGRAVAMLRRYMRYSMETGRLPSVLGQEFFRAKVTSYTVATFEDRVIFVHDMERCLERLDEFSQQLIARHILQEHDRRSTARLLHCNEKTVRRLTPLVLDQFSEILLDMGLMERVDAGGKNCCQGGLATESRASHWEESK